MKTILITGGAGFIGSNLCAHLLKDETNHVIVVDNFFTGKLANLHSFRENPRLEIIRHDIILPLYIEADEIYHLGCPASPIHYQHNGIKTIKTNVLGTLNILGIAKRTNAKILLASTSEVYGDPLENPQKESYLGNVNCIGPRACYDEGKRLAETLFMEYHKSCNLDIRIARIFNTYGPNMSLNDGRVVSNFIVQSLRKEELTIYGEGTQTRSFCYVDDMVQGLVKLMNTENCKTPINLGNPFELTINDIADEILSMVKTKFSIDNTDNKKYLSLPQDDPLKRKPDISLAKAKLNWNPKVNLEEGLEKTISYFKDILKIL